MTSPRYVLAADIGGTKLAAALVDQYGRVVARTQRATPRTSAPSELYAAVVGLCREVLRTAASSAAAIGVGCAGPMRYPEGLVSPLNMPAWRDFPLRQRLTDDFALPCLVDNDAKAVALGEHWLGVGQGILNMMGMVVSTGVGGGVIVDGRLLHGASGNAGHIGHVVVWPNGPLCRCGARGCVEAIASGTAIALRLAEAIQAGQRTEVLPDSTAAEIAVAARAGDPLARRLFQEAGEAVGRGIASTAALLDLSLVAIGGSVALRSWDLLAPPLEAELRRSARLGFSSSVQAVQATLGDDAGLVGAAALGHALLDPGV